MKQHVKQEYMIVQGSQKPIKELDIDGHKIKLDTNHSQNFVADAGLAKEIEARYGTGKGKGGLSKDFSVFPVNRVVEQGHNYTMSVGISFDKSGKVVRDASKEG